MMGIIWKNLMRRKIRTLLTVAGIAIGVAAIVSLSALADGFQMGSMALLRGSKADLVISQPDAFDLSMSSIDESLAAEFASMPEVKQVSGMIQGYSEAEGQPFFFVFGYPEGSFVLERYSIKGGAGLAAQGGKSVRGRPLILGAAAAEVLGKAVGDAVRVGGKVFRVVGIYETGDAMEDSGAVMLLKDAQELLGKPRQVSLFYIQLKHPELRERLIQRVQRRFPDLSIGGVQDLAEQSSLADMLRGYVWAISGLAVVIGGVGMMNAQLMSVFERTREIGVLRAIGWGKAKILGLVLGEALMVCFVGGVVGSLGGVLLIYLLSTTTTFFGVNLSILRLTQFATAFGVVMVLGITGGLYPAWRAAQLPPIEALRYEGGGSGARVRRLPFGGMALQSLWQRSTRTALTLSAIGLAVGGIMAMEAVLRGAFQDLDAMILSANAEIMLRQANISDTGFSAIDEETLGRIAALPEVQAVSGLIFTAVTMPEAGGFFVVQGYAPNEFFIQRIRVVEGQPLTTNHQILVGRTMMETLGKKVGDTLELSRVRFRIVGVYESKVSWEELGGVITLRDAQSLAGRPRKVSMAAVKLRDPRTAEAMVKKINHQFPEVHATLSTEFSRQMPDRLSAEVMLNAISFLAIFVGGIGVLNTMLMSVFERTREIGVLRALGWRRRQILGMILKEALILGLLGGWIGVVFAFVLGLGLTKVPLLGGLLHTVWEWDIFGRALGIAIGLGVLGGAYPAYRATRLRPVEALRYE
ncbi:MAG: FtsX-like permease family protein [Anaerolineales bacterium]|nr:ABC transporter permease [Anaerolineales bacterium]MDW8446082.1 FtsX-like permease family protein [Anaerolineales bacterium]